METIQYKTHGTCCKIMNILIDNDIIKDAEFFGGCSGNLQGIKHLIKNMSIKDVIEKLEGIDCNGKGTSCPDQLAKCLIEYSKQKSISKTL